jgi:hypothetical protein
MELQGGLVGSSTLTILLTATPASLGVVITMFRSNAKISKLVVFIASIISVVAFTVYFIRGSSFQTGLVLVTSWLVQIFLLFIGIAGPQNRQAVESGNMRSS